MSPSLKHFRFSISIKMHHISTGHHSVSSLDINRLKRAGVIMDKLILFLVSDCFGFFFVTIIKYKQENCQKEIDYRCENSNHVI